MNEQQVRAIIRDEINRQQYQAGKPSVLVHTHDGVNSPKLPESSIVPSTKIISGNIKFAENNTYTLYFTSTNQTTILFNGIAFQTGSGNQYAIINGTASLVPTLYFQPVSNSAVKVGGTLYPQTSSSGPQTLAQSSINLWIKPATSGTASGGVVTVDGDAWGLVDGQYIVDVRSGNTLPDDYLVVGQLLNLTSTSVDFVVTRLASGWELAGGFTIF